MAVKGKIVCDVCGAEKKETNHWFTVNLTLWGGIRFDRWNYENPGNNLSADFHLCGEQCCQKKLSDWTTKGITQ